MTRMLGLLAAGQLLVVVAGAYLHCGWVLVGELF